MKLPVNTPARMLALLALAGCFAIQPAFSQDQTSYLQQLANTASVNNTAMVIPSGTYQISAPIEIRSSVTMSADTKIVATQAMSAIFHVGTFSPARDITISGGILECANLADGLWLRQYRHAQLTGVKVFNPLRYGFRIGDPTLSGGYEAMGTNLYVNRTVGQFQPGSVALFVDTNATDCNFNQAILVGMDIGVQVKNGGNFFSNIHAWSAASMGMMSIAFDDQGHGNFWNSNVADSVMIGLKAHGYNTMVSMCRFFNNALYSSPNAVGIEYVKSAPYSTVTACVFSGSAGHPMATDLVGATPTAAPSKILQWVGNVTANVTVSH